MVCQICHERVFSHQVYKTYKITRYGKINDTTREYEVHVKCEKKDD